MLNVLRETELLVLPSMLRNKNVEWKSLLIDYGPPIVERVWTQLGKYRVNLDRIHPCAREESLFHPHPWPSAMRLQSGSYMMDSGHGRGDQEPSSVDLTVNLAEGSDYEMINPDGWHRIYSKSLLHKPSMSFMLTGKPWGEAFSKQKQAS